ncbi:hypothetical protein SLS58_003701 [Diplodia intermedia]|uniref:Uncharacterized protein n=1 Tax=Diplodia intermedia TaxID=856260 RepID=A0ABR3TWN5_9PEZI
MGAATNVTRRNYFPNSSNTNIPPTPGTGGAQHNAGSGTGPNLLDPDDPLNLKKPRGGGGAADDEPVIRFFEQDVSEMGKTAPRPVSRARMDADERAYEALWQKIARLEREIADIEGGDDAELDATLMRLRAIERRGGDLDINELHSLDVGDAVDMLADAEPDAVRAQLEALRVPGEEVPGRRGEAVARLNNCLRHAFLATQPKHRPVVRLELWKAYKRAKLHCPGVLGAIPDPAWDMLFYTQAVRWKSNEKREEHVAELLEDMKSVGMDGPPTSPPDRKGEETLVD